MNIQFGEALWLDGLRAELELPAGPLRPAKRRAIVKRLAHQAMHVSPRG